MPDSAEVRTSSTAGIDAELAAEQAYTDTVYAKLDAERADTAVRLSRVLADQPGSAPQARTEREVAAAMYRERLAQLNGVEAGLYFGRLDNTDGSITRIGRIGLFDEDADYEPLLIDWRAPAARPFYLATAASPQGVRRRRHVRLRLREVVGYDDEVLDLDSDEQGSDLGLAGEAALLAALNRQRGDQMRDIVATIQAEQDEIIRSPMGGVLVVQGGPGTGKTAVALHRAAYLLYEHRELLSSRGVLIVGPNRTFLHYIGQVLPSLGETGVLMATMGELFPGVRAQAQESPEAAEIKGRRVMVEVLRRAVADRQQVPPAPWELETESGAVTLHPEIARAARARAREADRPHNIARKVFADAVLDALAQQATRRLADAIEDGLDEIPFVDGEDPHAELMDQQDVAEARAELHDAPAVRKALDALWPELTPQRLLADLLSDPARLASAADGLLTEAEQRAVLRERGGAWTPSDVPLLDELAELLGEDRTEEEARRERERREQLAYAQGVLHILEQDDEIADEERLRVRDILDAEMLAEREAHRAMLTAAERAAADRTWTFGHVIVDEAQELTPMDWRVLMRRCPSRSMTVVGDIAQTGAMGGARSWQEVLEPFVGDRWRLAELTVNYRTPAEIMAVAAEALRKVDPALQPPRSVRETGVPPWEETIAGDRLVGRLSELVDRELAAADGGTVAVLGPPRLVSSLRPKLHRERVSVLTVQRAKGLEFDAVIVLEPEEIAAASPRGYSDLYVALTRATQRLGVIRTE
ncbi:ATP-binding domain-containing protein [Thermocrispum sp.]|uniref:ATP-binding domain-containing protein n=1 Tax=Thermocrispum sp. TaxID=2060768 RepID=UPI00257CE6F5|nr:ATP-binding domain-containing protein [Thermocrispum sp.]